MQAALSKFASYVGAPALLQAVHGSTTITVVNHHRIDKTTNPDFRGLKSLISATPTMFDRQLTYIGKHYNPISGSQLTQYLLEHRPLPAKPCLITFDDGYLDNFHNAYPLLLKHNMPAVIFLATGSIDQPAQPLWWDLVADRVRQYESRTACLPLLGECLMENLLQREAVSEQLVTMLKALPANARQLQIDDLQQQLRSSRHILRSGRQPAASHTFFMDWPTVREMSNNGIEFHAHTVTHPILSQLNERETQLEINQSRNRIESQLQREASLFAYPNGGENDYNATTLRALRQCGFVAAFTLAAGPQSLQQCALHPLEIRRVYLSHKDSWSDFQLKISGLPRLLNHVRRRP